MGIIILAVLGGVTGWLAAIIMFTEDLRQIAQNVVAGMIAALLVGELANTSPVMEGINAGAILPAFVASLAALVVLHIIRSRAAT